MWPFSKREAVTHREERADGSVVTTHLSADRRSASLTLDNPHLYPGRRGRYETLGSFIGESGFSGRTREEIVRTNKAAVHDFMAWRKREHFPREWSVLQCLEMKAGLPLSPGLWPYPSKEAEIASIYAELRFLKEEYFLYSSSSPEELAAAFVARVSLRR